MKYLIIGLAILALGLVIALRRSKPAPVEPQNFTPAANFTPITDEDKG